MADSKEAMDNAQATRIEGPLPKNNTTPMFMLMGSQETFQGSSERPQVPSRRLPPQAPAHPEGPDAAPLPSAAMQAGSPIVLPKTYAFLIKEGKISAEHLQLSNLGAFLRIVKNFDYAALMALNFRREDVLNELLETCNILGRNYQIDRFRLLQHCCKRFVYNEPEEWFNVIKVLLKYQMNNLDYYKILLTITIQTASDTSIIPPDLSFRFSLKLFWKLFHHFKNESSQKLESFISACPIFNALLLSLKSELEQRWSKSKWLTQDPLRQGAPQSGLGSPQSSKSPKTPNGAPSNLSASLSSFTLKTRETFAFFASQFSDKTSFLPQFLLTKSTTEDPASNEEQETPDELCNLLSFELDCETIDKKETHDGLASAVNEAFKEIDAEIQRLSGQYTQYCERRRTESFGSPSSDGRPGTQARRTQAPTRDKAGPTV